MIQPNFNLLSSFIQTTFPEFSSQQETFKSLFGWVPLGVRPTPKRFTTNFFYETQIHQIKKSPAASPPRKILQH